MSWLVSIFTSSGLGAITGLVGGWLAKREARKMKELDHEHEKAMGQQNLEALKMEQAHALQVVDKNIDLAEAEGKIEVESKEVDAFVESIKQQGKQSGHKFFDGLLRWVRPGITFWLLYMLVDIQSMLEQATGGIAALPMEQKAAMFVSIIDAILFLATTATGWWFASRRGQT